MFKFNVIVFLITLSILRMILYNFIIRNHLIEVTRIIDPLTQNSMRSSMQPIFRMYLRPKIQLLSNNLSLIWRLRKMTRYLSSRQTFKLKVYYSDSPGVRDISFKMEDTYNTPQHHPRKDLSAFIPKSYTRNPEPSQY